MRVEKASPDLTCQEQLERVRAAYVHDRLNLYLDLKKLLGAEKGVELYKKLYDEGMKRIRKNFPGGRLPVGELMKRELVSFPVLGFELHIDHEIENGEDVYYEHLTTCPFLNAARAMHLEELPCDFICAYDVEVATRDKRGRWEIKSRMGDGATECLFRIRDWPAEDL